MTRMTASSAGDLGVIVRLGIVTCLTCATRRSSWRLGTRVGDILQPLSALKRGAEMVHWLPPPRARIGLIIPSSNRLTELHFNRYAPEGVHAHVTRLRMTGAFHVPVLELLPKITEAAMVLSDTR